MRWFHHCLGLTRCQQRRCPVTVTTKGEQTGENPITFLVETNIWTAPDSFSSSHITLRRPLHGHSSLFRKAIKNNFFPPVLFVQGGVLSWAHFLYNLEEKRWILPFSALGVATGPGQGTGEAKSTDPGEHLSLAASPWAASEGHLSCTHLRSCVQHRAIQPVLGFCFLTNTWQNKGYASNDWKPSR